MGIDDKHNGRRVVITGMGCVSPLGCSPQGLFKNLLEGKSNFVSERGVMVSFVSDSFERKCCEWGLQNQRSTQAYAICAIKDAIAFSGFKLNENPSVGMCIGSSQNLSDPNSKQGDILSFIAHEIGFLGECISLPVACSGGNVALAVAMSKIQTGNADIFLAGGVERYTDLCFSTFDVLQILSKEGCRPFSSCRDGITIGEGAAFFVLEDMEHAKARNAPILGEIASYSIRCDSTHLNTPDVYGESASLAMRDVVCRAGIKSSDIGYISPHGTGTITNDLQEINAIYSVFGELSCEIPISAIKSMLGHCMGAASSLEAVAAIQSLLLQKIPNTIRTKDDDEDHNYPFVPNLSNFELNSFDYVLSNSFAFGGNIACIIFKRFENE